MNIRKTQRAGPENGANLTIQKAKEKILEGTTQAYKDSQPIGRSLINNTTTDTADDSDVFIVNVIVCIHIFSLYYPREVAIEEYNCSRGRIIRPPLNKDLFPVDRPSGFKRADWNYFFPYFWKKFVFPKKFCTL